MPITERENKTLEKIKEIIDIPNTVIQEDVMKYKMICEVIENDIVDDLMSNMPITESENNC